MKHAGQQALDSLEDLLVEIRKIKGLTERKRGAFYLKSAGMLHFHEDPAGMFADIKVDGEWRRISVNTSAEHRALLKTLATVVGIR
ncbi:MAG TPA: hypothetical protein VG778_01700 [Blastocatellia bacterium]|jgi:hypothetical protein|nr:hypothetical protein [Blastocatellia bacterium]